MFVWNLLRFRVHQGKSRLDEVAEISSTEPRCCDNVGTSFNANVTNKSQMSSSPFTKKTVSPFTLAAKPNAARISPKKSPLSSSAAAGISQSSSGISGATNFPVDRHVGASSSFMKSDHISRLNFNSVSTTSMSSDVEPAGQWLSSFMEARTPTAGFSFPTQPVGSFTSPTNSVEDEMSPPILKPKVRRSSHRTPDKSPLVTSSSGDVLELGKPSVGLGEPPGFSDLDAVEFEASLSHGLPLLNLGINSTSRTFSTSSTDNGLDEQPLYDRIPVSAKNTKQPSSARSDSYSSAGSDHKGSNKVSKPIVKDKLTSKSRSRSAKQKAKSPAGEEYERQRSELDNAFEAACRLPSTVRGQPSSDVDTTSGSNNRWSAFNSQKVSCVSIRQIYCW